jgi:plastocyanin
LRTWIIIVLGGLAVAAALAVVVVLRTGLSADRAPSRVETAVARQLVRPSIPVERSALQSPLSGPESTTDSMVGVRVVIDGTRFHPDEATISLGESAHWSNADPFPHNVTSESGTFHSEDLAPDGTWVFQPTERGTFEYHCTLHPGMKAVLRVR